MSDQPKRPNPGSDEAIKAGCTCPVFDNHHGRGFLRGGAPVFWITSGCPIHSPKAATE